MFINLAIKKQTLVNIWLLRMSKHLILALLIFNIAMMGGKNETKCFEK
jgi:hypothetical protein